MYIITGITTADESIFRYDNGKGHADYNNAEFVPKFYDEFTTEQIADSSVVCRDGKKECIYDFVITQNRELASATSAVLEEAAKIQAVIGMLSLVTKPWMGRSLFSKKA